MKLYSDFPVARIRQIAADVTALALIVLAIVVGSIVHGIVSAFADLGRQLEDAGSGFRQTMTDAAETLGDVPFVGNGIRSPFDSASDAGRVLQDAGSDQQILVAQLAALAALVVALVPIAIVLRYWLARRVAFARRAAFAASLSTTPAGVDLLALRALASRDLRSVFAVAPDPAAAWRSGDPVVGRALADIALRDAGVRAS